MKKLIKYIFLMGILLGTASNVLGMKKDDGIDRSEFQKRLSIWKQKADLDTQVNSQPGNMRRSVAQPRATAQVRTSGSLDVKDVTVPQAQPKVKAETKKPDALAAKFNSLSLTSQSQQPAPAPMPNEFSDAKAPKYEFSDPKDPRAFILALLELDVGGVTQPKSFVAGLTNVRSIVLQTYKNEAQEAVVLRIANVFDDWLGEEEEIDKIRDENRKTPLHFAAERNSKDLCTILVTGGASPFCEDFEGISPFMIAVGKKNPEIYKYFFKVYATTKNPRERDTIFRQLDEAREIREFQDGAVQATEDYVEFQQAQAKPTATPGDDPVVGVDGEFPQICNKGANSENQMMLYGDGEEEDEA